MKKIILAFLIFGGCVALFVGCDIGLKTEDCLRIHIRANSNTLEDQSVKYKVKESVVEYLTPYVIDCKSYDDVVWLVKNKERELENLVDEVLVENGFAYVCDVELNEEYFPTRTYENFTLESNYYDAIIINLGQGAGDNWWCVVYPPLCFKDTKNIVYKSKIMEIINKLI